MNRLVSPRLAGRESELSALAQAFADVCGGTQRTLLIGAEAGGGKSRLIREFAERVRGDALLLSGGCVEQSEAGLPYAPFTAALRELVRARGVADIGALLGAGGTSDLARLLPEFGASPSASDPELARARLFEVLRRLLERLAEQRPLVWVVEDVHWADHATRDLLSFLAGNLQHASVLLAVSYRSEALHRAHPLRALLAELGRLDAVTALTLPRLSRREVAAQLEGILGRPPEPAVVSAVHRRGDGIPLFTEALIGADGNVRSGLPGSLRDLLLGVMHELPERTQQVLRAAAVGGVRVGHALLAAVTGIDGTALTAALRPAVAANVLISDDSYAFRHALIREALRDDLLAGERAQLHRAFAEALEADPSLSPQTWVSVGLALHWYGAHDDERALRAAWQAAGEAKTGLAYAEQLQMLEQVLQLWQRVPDAARHTGVQRVDVIEQAADAACWAAEPQRGLALVDAALAELDAERDSERVAAMLLQRAPMRQQQLRPGQLDDLQAALRLASAPTRVRAECLGQLCRALMQRDRHAEAKPLAGELSRLAVRLHDEAYRIDACVTLAQLGARDGADTVAALRAAADAARRIGSGWLEVLAYIAMTEALEGRGDQLHAIETGRAGLARTLRVGQARYMGAVIAQSLARSLESAGRWDEALQVVDDALALDPAPSGRALLLLCRTPIAIARGDQQTAARIVQELRSLPDDAQRTLSLLELEIEYKLCDGDLDGALAAAARVPAHGEGADPRRLWPLLAVAMRACVDARDQPTLRRTLEATAASMARPGPVEEAYAAAFVAERSRVADRPDASAWEVAADAWARLGRPYPHAYALLRSAAAAATARDRTAAADRLRRAADLATELGAAPLLVQITALARRARIELKVGDGGAADDVPFGLTGRELEVLQLIAAGRSNREIASELFISPKTASVHVSNILAKLDVSTRGAAAAAAHRLHLFEPR